MSGASGIAVTFVLRLSREYPEGALPVECWWRSFSSSAGTERKASPLQRLMLSPDEDREILEGISSEQDRVALLALKPYWPEAGGNCCFVPLEDFSCWDALSEVAQLRWTNDLHLHPLRLQWPRGLSTQFSLEWNERENLRFLVTAIYILPDGTRHSANEVQLLGQNLALVENTLTEVEFNGAKEIAQQFSGRSFIELDYAMASALSRTIALETTLDDSHFPESLRFQKEACDPAPELYVRTAKFKYRDHEQLHAELSFHYGNAICAEGTAGHAISDGPHLYLRNELAEERATERLKQLGFRWANRQWEEEIGWKLSPSRLDEAVEQLVLQDGWLVRAEGKSYRRPVTKSPQVGGGKSGMDWFEVSPGLDFDGLKPSMPALLAALRHEKNTVRLDDGTYGLLPQEWLENFTALTELGEISGDKIRFRIEQAALVESILQNRLQEAMEEEAFRGSALELQLQRMRQLGDARALAQLQAEPPEGLQAQLRSYQKSGLAWLLLMSEMHLGACLADDMGLGKTIQILALLLTRQAQGKNASLVVMPRSLLFNWQEEAAKFAPSLKLYLYWGAERQLHQQDLTQYNLILTTYGTLRNDAVSLSELKFDLCILDESQAIKNGDSSTARAARMIQAEGRIAMTGTPIENRVGDLYSQLSFLNPGLFGPQGARGEMLSHGSESLLSRIRRSVSPFLLRRTKEQVAKELPQKTEQVLYAEFSPEEQREYHELHLYLREKTEQNEKSGQGGSVDVLAALTRLRQASCHFGLLQENRRVVPSAKMTLLFDLLEPLAAAGHKALIFSQFTTFLALLRTEAEKRGLRFSYLDGETKDRPEQVRHFQEEPECSLFFISLKAGGVGLNLTAADYVFLMDPWWNPAAESQAVDRAYRIGQQRPVFAYRLVTKGTIEEKVLELQRKKRRLAQALVEGKGIDGLPVPEGQPDADTLRSLLNS